MREYLYTYFKNIDNNETIGTEEGILPISLYKGMNITIHGYPVKVFKVVEWNYHLGLEDEEGGLMILIKEINKNIKVSDISADELGL